MTDHVSPVLVETSPTDSINTLLIDRVAANPNSVLLETRDGSGWAPMTAAAFEERVVSLARGLIAHGVQVGDRIAIMCHTRPEWALLDFAIWAVGGVSVPVYETSAADQVRWALSDSGVSLAFVETAEMAQLAASVRDGLPELREVQVIDEGALEALDRDGADIPVAEVTARRGAVRAEDLATIIYTSGATGRPKGSELTHRNFVHLARNGAEGLYEIVGGPGSRTLLFLPLAHVFARYIEVVVIHAGAQLALSPDTRHLVEDLGTFQPTFLLAVPRVLEKVYNTAEQKAGAGFKRKLFHRATKVSVTYSRALDTARGPSAVLRIQRAFYDLLVYRKLRATMGGRLKWVVSGGAPLGERLGHYYRGVGLHVLEGYGLTETTAPTAVNRPGLTKLGTVGPPFPGATLRVDDAGEVWVKGDHVFRAYHNQPERTADALIDGWFRTGDLGSFDDDGYLSITGRKKEIIVTAGGKNVAPSILEDRLRSYSLISQVVVVGDKRPFIAALVTLDEEMLPGWLAAHGLPSMSVQEAAQNPAILAALEAAVERANRAVSRAESIRKFTVLTTDFTVENQYLTPSLKVKRDLVLNDFEAEIDNIYGGPVVRVEE